MGCTIYVAKTNMLFSFAVTALLICAFVLAYAKNRFSHDVAHTGRRIHYFNMHIWCNFYCYDMICFNEVVLRSTHNHNLCLERK